MKTKLIALALIVAGATFASAVEKEEMKAPNGGRMIHGVDPHAEFLVTKDKKVEIRFLDDAGKVVAPAAQTVTVTMGERANPTKLAFTKDGDKLVSDKTVAEGKDLPVVLQIKATPDGKTVTEKFNLNMSTCPECKLGEYACACDHAAGDHKGHDHKPGEKHKH